jgi:hypothetical protein
MRTWLFYKETPVEGGVQVEFRRVDADGITNFLPDLLQNSTKVPDGEKTEQFVKSLVRRSGWVLGAAQPAESDLGKTVLRGRWALE